MLKAETDSTKPSLGRAGVLTVTALSALFFSVQRSRAAFLTAREHLRGLKVSNVL